jgi:hypothetical protein
VLARLQKDLSLQSDREVNLMLLTPEKLERLKIEDTPIYNSLAMSSVTLKGKSQAKKDKHLICTRPLAHPRARPWGKGREIGMIMQKSFPQ